MAVRQARGVQARPGRVPRRGFAAHGAAFLWRTLCAATGGTGFGAGPRFHGARGGILWRTLCAATGGTGLAQGAQNAETVAANIVRHGRSSGEGRTGPAGTCAPPRFCGARGRIFVANTVRRYRGHGVWRRSAVSRRTGRHFVAHAVRRYRGYGVGAGRTKCRDRSGEHCSPWPFVRRGAYRPGRDVCPAAVSRRTGPHFCGAHCAPLRGVRGWRRSAVLRRTGPHFCGAQCAPLQGVRGLAQVRGFTAHGSAFCGAQCAPLQGGGFAAHGAVPDFSRTGPDSIVHYQGGVQVEPRWSSDEDSKQSMNKL